VQSWYKSLPEEDKTLFMAIDFSTIGSIEEAEEALEQLQKEADEQAAQTYITDNAEKYGLDPEVLQT
jgi:hypothetical protein